jgi:death-on-curing protein
VTAWLSVEVVIDLQRMLIDEFGGASGLRDRGGLEAAVARPRQIEAYEEDASIFRLAAALAYGLTQNHAFVDGNKRIALTAAGVFLGLNGWYLDAVEQDAVRFTLELSSRQIDEHAFAAWLEACSVRL